MIEMITADTDADAVKQARPLAEKNCIEVWEGARRVARIERGS